MIKFGLSVVLAGLLGVPSFVFAQFDVSINELPDYKPTKLEASRLSSVGSDSMDDLMQLWVEAYEKYQPEVKINVVSRGSATAPAALIDGSADLGPMVRTMKTPERKEFLSKYGFEPTQIKTSLAAVGIYVSTKNPLDQISFKQLDSIYSTTQQRGGSSAIIFWRDLGVAGIFSEEKLTLLKADQNSYTESIFRQQVLLHGDLKPNVLSTANNKALFEMIGQAPGAIGFGELQTPPPGIKLLAVSSDEGTTAVQPTLSNCMEDRYPLARFLNLYIVQEPDNSIDANVKDFLRFVLSKQGQEISAKHNLTPLIPKLAKEELSKLE